MGTDSAQPPSAAAPTAAKFFLKKVVPVVLKVGVTAFLFLLLFKPEFFGIPPDRWGGIDLRDMVRELQEAGAPNLAFWLTFAVVVRLCGMLCGVLRWRILLHGQGLYIPFWYMVGSWFIGRTFGIFLPGTIGLDGYRLYDSSLYTRDVIKCTTVIAVEKLIGFISLTLLVFLTFPLGFRLLQINVIILAVVLAILGAFVAVSFLTLLNPRVIQVLVAVLPTPAVIRNKINKIGASVTAYSANRKDLMLAVLCGLVVHGATAIMYFGTMMAIRADNTNIWDVLFASPLVIYSTVIGPTIGGEGVREIVGVALLGSKSGAAVAATFFHLGWWVGDVTPFLVGLFVFIVRKRPATAEIQARLAEMRRSLPQVDEDLHLPQETIAVYRGHLINYALAGVAGGLIGGAIIGLAEAAWLTGRAAGLTEHTALWWGAGVYGVAFTCVGLGVAAGLAFLSLLVDRFASPKTLFGMCWGGTLAAGAALIGWFRFRQDILHEHAPTLSQNLAVAGAALALGIAAFIVGSVLLSFVKGSRAHAVLATGAVYIALIAIGAFLSAARVAPAKALTFAPSKKAEGPNIILIAVDTLRADYLRIYNPNFAQANTPAIDLLRRDSVLFLNSFAQSSWTKASFATIFSGQYPETHTAVQKDSILPDSVVTFPELLLEAGYFTQGFANNPNIADTYNYGQGFVDYSYLRPRYLFGASQSAQKMVLYNVLRMVYQKAAGRLLGGRLNVRDFYQPAEEVTGHALTWLDDPMRPKDVPFFLFLHYMDPHDPYMDHENPGKGYARVRLGDKVDPGQYKELFQRVYNGEIEYCDRHIGGLLDGLKERGLYDNSVIVFTSDHGEEFHEHGGWWHGLSLYDEQIFVPLLIKLPGNHMAGDESTYMTRHVDLAPTLLQFAGILPAEGMQGVPLFEWNTSYSDLRNNGINHIYSHLDFEGIILRAVRTADCKLIRANEGNKRGYKPVEVYDLVADPGEQHNLAGQGVPCEPLLDETLTGMRAFVEENAAEPQILLDNSEVEDALRAVGYLGDSSNETENRPNNAAPETAQ